MTVSVHVAVSRVGVPSCGSSLSRNGQVTESGPEFTKAKIDPAGAVSSVRVPVASICLRTETFTNRGVEAPKLEVGDAS